MNKNGIDPIGTKNISTGYRKPHMSHISKFVLDYWTFWRFCLKNRKFSRSWRGTGTTAPDSARLPDHQGAEWDDLGKFSKLY